MAFVILVHTDWQVSVLIPGVEVHFRHLRKPKGCWLRGFVERVVNVVVLFDLEHVRFLVLSVPIFLVGQRSKDKPYKLERNPFQF